MKERVGKTHRQHEQGFSDLWDNKENTYGIGIQEERKKEKRKRGRDGRREERKGKGREAGKGYVK